MFSSICQSSFETPNGWRYRQAALELSSDCEPLAACPVEAVLGDGTMMLSPSKRT
jgi:hypothetical protein